MKNKKSKTLNYNENFERKSKYLLLSISLIVIVCILIVGGAIVGESGDVERVVLNNTNVNGLNVGGLSESNANLMLKQHYEKRLEDFNLKLTYKDKVWEFNNDDFVVSSNIHTIAEEIQLRDKKLANKEAEKKYIKDMVEKGESLNVAFNYIFVGIDSKVNEIAKVINSEPVNSKINFLAEKNKPFDITDDICGVQVDVDKLYAEIEKQFKNSNNIEVEIPIIEIKADVTKADNLSKTKLISTFETNVADSTGNRKYNVKKALSKFNGLVVMPNEEISFNKLTGPQTLENGYKVATIILNGKFVDGVGGGICQASTTLYNALIRSNVKINEVNKHTLPVKYVPLALDAMVSEGISDLKFQNTSEYPIYIQTYSTPERVGVKIYSHELENGTTIKARSKIIKVLPHLGDEIKVDVNKQYQDKVLFKGEQYRVLWPREGYVVESYLDYYDKNGKLIKEELIRKETYKPQKGLIVEGAEPVPNGLDKIETDVKKLEQAENAPNVSETEAYNMAYENAIPVNYCP